MRCATFTDGELNARLSAVTGDATPAPMRFFSFKDPEEHTKEQIATVRSHPWIAKDVPVRGFVFDVGTGRLREVMVDKKQGVDRHGRDGVGEIGGDASDRPSPTL